MPRPNRGDLIIEGESQVFHCVQKCARYCRLFGKNPVSGEDCDHRKQWVLTRLNQLVDIFLIECLTYAVREDEVEVVIRSRPDLVEALSDEEVADRWCQLFPRKPKKNQSPEDALSSRIAEITGDKETLKETRIRLSNISWFMRCFAEDIARRANQEEDCRGRFWSGRFDAKLLLDAEAVLASAVHIDCSAANDSSAKGESLAGINERGTKRDKSDGQGTGNVTVRLAPLRPKKAGRLSGSDRALPKNDAEYLKIVQWTGKQLRQPSRGRNPSPCGKLLRQMNLKRDMWLAIVRDITQACPTVAGTPASIAKELERQTRRSFFRMPHNPLAQAS